jgi:hypothetical protein
MEDSEGKRVEYAGNYGQTHYIRKPFPPHPRKITDKYGWEWLYLGKIDDDTARVSKANPDGSVDIASLHAMDYNQFPCFNE